MEKEKLRGQPSPQDIRRGKEFALWLRQARARKGWTKKYLHQSSGVSDTYIGVLEADGINNSTGQYQRPSEAIIAKLADALKSEADESDLENAGRKAAGYSVITNRLEVPAIETIVLRSGVVVEVLAKEGDPSLPLVITPRIEAILNELALLQKERESRD